MDNGRDGAFQEDLVLDVRPRGPFQNLRVGKWDVEKVGLAFHGKGKPIGDAVMGR